MTPKVYLASNIVSAIAKDDTPTEPEALNRLLQAWDDKKGRSGHLRGDAVGNQDAAHGEGDRDIAISLSGRPTSGIA